MSRSENEYKKKPNINIFDNKSDIELTNKYEGLCEDAEVLWLGYLSYCYKFDIIPHIVKSFDDKKNFLGYAIKKTKLEGLNFGDPTEIILKPSKQFPELQDLLISREKEKVGIVARNIRTPDFSNYIAVASQGRQGLPHAMIAFLDIHQTLYPDKDVSQTINSIWIFLLDWAKLKVEEASNDKSFSVSNFKI